MYVCIICTSMYIDMGPNVCEGRNLSARRTLLYHNRHIFSLRADMKPGMSETRNAMAQQCLALGHLAVENIAQQRESNTAVQGGELLR